MSKADTSKRFIRPIKRKHVLIVLAILALYFAGFQLLYHFIINKAPAFFSVEKIESILANRGLAVEKTNNLDFARLGAVDGEEMVIRGVPIDVYEFKGPAAVPPPGRLNALFPGKTVYKYCNALAVVNYPPEKVPHQLQQALSQGGECYNNR